MRYRIYQNKRVYLALTHDANSPTGTKQVASVAQSTLFEAKEVSDAIKEHGDGEWIIEPVEGIG